MAVADTIVVTDYEDVLTPPPEPPLAGLHAAAARPPRPIPICTGASARPAGETGQITAKIPCHLLTTEGHGPTTSRSPPARNSHGFPTPTAAISPATPGWVLDEEVPHAPRLAGQRMHDLKATPHSLGTGSVDIGDHPMRDRERRSSRAA